MSAPYLVGLFIEPLERIDVPYMATGAVASVIYGDSRFTRDIDVVLALDVLHIAELESVFGGGAFYVPPREVLEAECRRAEGGRFKVIQRDTPCAPTSIWRGMIRSSDAPDQWGPGGPRVADLVAQRSRTSCGCGASRPRAT